MTNNRTGMQNQFGSSAELESLVRQHYATVYAVAFARLRDHEVAEDLAQEVFLRAVLRPELIAQARSVEAWLVVVTRNLACDWQRSNQRTSRLVALIPVEEIPMEIEDTRAENPRDEVAGREEENLLRQAVLNLPPELREVVILRFSQGLTNADIARMYGVNRSSVARQVDHALEILKANVEGRLGNALRPFRARRRPAQRAVILAITAAALTPALKTQLLAATANTAALAVQATAPVAGLSALLSVKAVAVIVTLAALTGSVIMFQNNRAYTVRSGSAPHVGSSPSFVQARSRSGTGRTSQRGSAQSATPAPNARQLVVSGRVSLAGGSPADGAVVQRLCPARMDEPYGPMVSNKAVTGATGEYRFEGPSFDDSPLIKVSKKGCATVIVDIVDQLHHRTTRGQIDYVTRDITLVPASLIRGRVTDDKGKPASHVGVAVAMPPSKKSGIIGINLSETTTTADGSFSVEDVPAGPSILVVDDDQYVPTYEDAVAPVENVAIHVSASGGSIAGRVVQKPQNQPVRGARVTLLAGCETDSGPLIFRPRSTVSDRRGEFQLGRLAAGRYWLQVKKEGLSSLSNMHGNGFGGALQLAAGESTSGVELPLFEGYAVQGRITEKDSSKPIVGARVFIGGWGGPQEWGRKYATITGADGSYSLMGFQENTNAIPMTVEKDGYMAVRRGPFASSPVPEQLEIREDSFLYRWDAEMVKLTDIAGTVVSGADRPISGASVSVTMSNLPPACDKKVVTGQDGTFVVQAPPYTTVRVKAEVKGFPIACSETINVLTDATTNTRIVVRPGGNITGTVLGPNGSPIAGAVVHASSAYNNSTSLPTGSNGEFILTGVAQEDNTLHASKKGFSDSVSLGGTVVGSGETRSDVKLALRTSHFIAGKVTGGWSDMGEAVFARGLDTGVTASTRSDKNGAYRIDDVPSGRYEVSGVGGQKVKTDTDRDDVNIDLRRDRPQMKTVAVLPGGGEMRVAITPTPKPAVAYTGRVVDGRTSEPLRDFSLASLSDRLEKDPTLPGVFRITSAHVGESFDVRISAPGFAPRDEHIVMPAGKDSFEQTFAMGTGVSLSGRFVDRQTRQPISGVRLLLKGRIEQEFFCSTERGAVLKSVVTGADGRFLFPCLQAGSQAVAVIPPNSDHGPDSVFKVADKDVDVGDIELGAERVVRGKVVRGRDEKPAAGVAVRLAGENSIQKAQTTGADGAFEFRDLANFEYTLSLPEEHISTKANLTRKDREETVLRLGQATLQGKITRGTTQDRHNITLTRESISLEGTTGSDGSFMIANLTPGKWHYSMGSSADRDVVAANGELEVVEGINEKSFALSSSQISGRVEDPSGDSNQSVNVALVRVTSDGGYDSRNTAQATLFNNNNQFTFKALPEGTYAVVASKYNEGSAVRSGISISGEGSSVSVVLKLAKSGGVLVSKVLGSDTSQPLEEVHCSLYGTHGSNVSRQKSSKDKTGLLTIEDLPPGAYNVTFSARGPYSSANHYLIIEGGTTTTLQEVLHLRDTGDFTWTFRDAQGKPLKGVECRLERVDGNTTEAACSGHTEPNGEFGACLRAGKYRAIAEPAFRKPITIDDITITVNGDTRRESKVE